MARVVCAGHCNWDVTLLVDDLPEPDGEATVRSETGARGGSAGNVASALARQGVDATLLASVGDDERGAAALAALRAVGVDCDPVRVLAGATTTVKYCVVDDDGRVMLLGHEGANEAYDADDLPDGTLARADCLHLTGQAPRTALELARRGREAGLTVSFDPGRRVASREYAEVVALTDLLFVNDSEAAALSDLDALVDPAAAGVSGPAGDGFGRDRRDGTGGGADSSPSSPSSSSSSSPAPASASAPDPEPEAAGGARPRGPAVVVTRGVRGAEFRSPAGYRQVHPGFDVDVVDATGAGDAFAAGYLAARLAGEPVSVALRRANACGALATRSAGPTAAISPDALADLLDEW